MENKQEIITVPKEINIDELDLVEKDELFQKIPADYKTYIGKQYWKWVGGTTILAMIFNDTTKHKLKPFYRRGILLLTLIPLHLSLIHYYGNTLPMNYIKNNIK